MVFPANGFMHLRHHELTLNSVSASNRGEECSACSL